MESQFIKEYLDARVSQMLELLENLVNRNTSSDCKAGVDEVGMRMAGEFERYGYAIEVTEHETDGNCVIARKAGRGRGAGKNVLLICHLDSVFPEGTEYIKPFTIEGDRAYGAGVVDMKACLVGCLFAVKALEELEVPDLPGIVVLMSGDEENGSHVALAAIENEGKKADWCIVTEGSRPGMAIVTQRKGNAYIRVHAHGRAAHAGNEPQVGRNAIDELVLKIVKLRQLSDFEVGTTFTVTRIEGGKNRIIVPEDAEFYADIRFYTMEEWQRVSNSVRTILSGSEIEGISLDYELTFNRPPLTQLPTAEPMLKLVREVSGQLGIPYLTTQPGGVSDGNFVAAAGTPTIDGMGPTGGMMCSPEEYLEINTMAPCAARLAAVISRLAQV